MDDHFQNKLEALVETIDLKDIYENDQDDVDQINLWLPIGYKEKFVQIQKRSKKKFGKKMKELIKLLIDKADALEEKAS